MKQREFPRLKDKVVLITGAAQGLGEALAIRLSEEGAKVVVGDMNVEGAKNVAAQLAEGIATPLNVCDYDSCVAAVQLAVDTYGRLDYVVANAGVVRSDAIEDMTYEEFSFVVKHQPQRLFQHRQGCGRAVPQAGGGGVIVQINSKSGKKGSAKNCAYAASKFGGIGLTESLALELAQEGIRVNSICPGNLLDSPLWVNSLYEQYARNQAPPRKRSAKSTSTRCPCAAAASTTTSPT